MYSLHTRRKILSIKKMEGLTFVETGKRFGMSPNTMFKWTKRIEPKKSWGKGSIKIDMAALAKDVKENPDLYQYERAKKFNVSQNCICKGLKRLGVSYKKTLKHPKADARRRTIFQKKIKEYEEKGRSIVYVDESGFAHDMPRTYGYSAIGDLCYGTQDWNAKGRQNVIAGLFGDSLIGCGIVEANVNTEVFNTWIEKVFIPDLPKNSIVVMDNATFHKSQKTKELLEINGHQIEFLPPYSPDLNPIERKWAQAKAIRKRENCNVHNFFRDYFS